MSNVSILTNYTADPHNVSFFQIKVIASHCHTVREHLNVFVKYQFILKIIYTVYHGLNLHFISFSLCISVRESINVQCLQKCSRLNYKIINQCCLLIRVLRELCPTSIAHPSSLLIHSQDLNNYLYVKQLKLKDRTYTQTSLKTYNKNDQIIISLEFQCTLSFLLNDFNPLFKGIDNMLGDFFDVIPKFNTYLVGHSGFGYLNINLKLIFALVDLVSQYVVYEPNNFGSNLRNEVFVKTLYKFAQNSTSFPIFVVVDEQSQSRLSDLSFQLLIYSHQFIKPHLMITFQNYLSSILFLPLQFLQCIVYLQNCLFDY